MGCPGSKGSTTAPSAQTPAENTLLDKKLEAKSPDEDPMPAIPDVVARTALLEKTFAACDAVSNGYLLLAEYRDLAADESKQIQNLMSNLFQMVDAAGVPDGKLSLDDFVKFNLEVGESLYDSDFTAQANVWQTLCKKRIPNDSVERNELSLPASLDREGALKEIFTSCDADSNGFLSLAEYQQLSTETDAKDQAIMTAVFEMIDEGGVKDGKLSLSEFIRFNLDSGKSLNDDEFQRQADLWLALALKRVTLGAAGRKALLEKVFRACDIDGNGWLSLEEYRQLASDESQQAQDLMSSLFQMIDAVGVCDGRLSPDEFVKFNLESGQSLSDSDFAVQANAWLTITKPVAIEGEDAGKVVPCCGYEKPWK